jgi:hypothetical protein
VTDFLVYTVRQLTHERRLSQRLALTFNTVSISTASANCKRQVFNTKGLIVCNRIRMQHNAAERPEDLIHRYQKNLEYERAQVNPDWMHSWICTDLKEWELVDCFKHGLSNGIQKKENDDIISIRGKLAKLQSKMVRCYVL